jgi:hypothetical protein
MKCIMIAAAGPPLQREQRAGAHDARWGLQHAAHNDLAETV